MTTCEFRGAKNWGHIPHYWTADPLSYLSPVLKPPELACWSNISYTLCTIIWFHIISCTFILLSCPTISNPVQAKYFIYLPTNMSDVPERCEILNNNITRSWLSHQCLVKLSAHQIWASGQKFLKLPVSGQQCFAAVSIYCHILLHGTKNPPPTLAMEFLNSRNAPRTHSGMQQCNLRTLEPINHSQMSRNWVRISRTVAKYIYRTQFSTLRPKWQI